MIEAVKHRNAVVRVFLTPALVSAMFCLPVRAQNSPSSAPSAEAPATPTPVAAALPPYFSGANDAKASAPTWPDPTGGSAGAWATPAGDGKGDNPNTIAVPDLYHRVSHNLFSINMVWAMLTGFLVMFMQAGFALLETGLCRSKNAAHTMSMNLMVYAIGALGFWAYGFAIGWGNWFNGPVPPGWYSSLGPGTSVLNGGVGIGAATDASGAPTGVFKYGLAGIKGFGLNGIEDVSVMALFFFMMVFFDTAATIPTGAMAERWSWKSFCIYSMWVALPYCLFANWVWGGGWLAQGGINWHLGHGAVDFAGSGVVHAMGGIIALAGAIVLGPRIGKYINNKPQAIPAHHIPMVFAGTFILGFGWFGFNPGSTLAGTDLRLSAVVVNTCVSSLAGATSAMLVMMWVKNLKPDPTMMCNGFLAGLVAITAPCAFVSSWAAVVIGLVAGVLVVYSVFFFEARGVDDPVGAVSVHFVNGLWGVLSVGIFANGLYGAGWNGVVRDEFVTKYGSDGVRGILYGDASQFLMQAINCCVLVVFGFAMAYGWFKFSNLITPIRVSRETEIAGLDNPEMGANSYPEFVREHAGADASSGGGAIGTAQPRMTGSTAMVK